MPLLDPTMDGRNKFFQTLKPQCVALSQAALALNGHGGNVHLVTQQLEDLKITLSKLTSRPHALDPKLADYIFFPLSQTLKLSTKLPIRSLELSLQCIAILVDQGWRDQIKPQLAAQIIILCTLMADKKPKGFAFSETTDDLQSAAFWCLYHIFTVAAESAECKAFLMSEANFPQFGQTITVVLDGIHDGLSVEPQIAATGALQALVEGVASREICAGFLPGIVSKLTKVLTPSTRLRRKHGVLVGCLSVVGSLLRTTLGDEPAVERGAKAGTASNSIITEQWTATAATQMKPALTSIVRLQGHSRDDVKEALARLCLVLLEHCRKSLATCSPLALETLLTLSAAEPESSLRLQLELLLRADPSLSGLLQTTVYDWLQSLPTIMQAADEQAKVRKMEQISTAYGLLVDSSVDTAVIDRMLAGSLRDSVVMTLRAPGGKKETTSNLVSPVQSLDLTVLDETKGGMEFGQPLVRYRGQEEVLASIDAFAQLISRSSSSAAFATDLARSLRLSQGETQIANFWLLLTATQTALQRKDSVDDLLDFGDERPVTSYEDHLEGLYALSLAVLNASPSDSDATGPPDPRLQALALRTLALRAQTSGQAFRSELIDALYPVLATLATPSHTQTHPQTLHRDTLITINTFATSCTYASVRALIVENVDYLTNAVALKLNAFDVSAQALRVLGMMVRLAGPGLVSYLEDVVESLIGVLEGWHGYGDCGGLVEGVWGTLGVLVEEGRKAEGLGIGGGGGWRKAIELVGKEGWRGMSVEGLAEMLRERREVERLERGKEGRKVHPRRPWKGVVDDAADDEEVARTSTDVRKETQDEGETLTQSDHPLQDDEDPTPPSPATYALLLKITSLTQHFLPSASASLRTTLLSLIRTTVPALARHGNSFLPLINTLWPEIVSRLEDEEAHARAAALGVVGALCEEAGGFMRSRIVQSWSGVVEMYRGIMRDVVSAGDVIQGGNRKELRDSGAAVVVPETAQALDRALAHLDSQLHLNLHSSTTGHYTDTSTRLVWDALIATLTTIVRCVPLPPEVFDQALEMLGPVLEREEVREALEGANGNADAVWLARVRRALVRAPAIPDGAGGGGWGFAVVPTG